MSSPIVERDERSLVIENAGYRWSYRLLSFGVLALAAYRGFTRGDNTLDLILLVVASGVVGTAYQASHQTLHRRWIVTTAVTIGVAALVAAALVFARRAP